MKTRVLLVALVLATAVASGASGGPPGQWTPITTGGGQSGTSNVGVARTSDGALHVVWQRAPGALLHTSISPSGRVGSATQIVTGWASVGDADVAVGARGELLAFWAGARTTNTEDPLFGLNLATSTTGGTSWTLTPASIATSGSFTRFQGADQHLCPAAARTPVVARAGGGFFVATVTGYPTETDLIVWRIGSGRPVVVARSKDGLSEEVALAADPSGRIWVGWSDSAGAKPVVYVRRSNRAVTAWGATVAVNAPASSVDFGNLDLAAQAGRLDVLARFGTGSGVNLFHTQVFPGLTLVAKGGKVVAFRVLDAGDPVAGATIKVGGRTLKTNAAGAASIDLRAGRYKAVASKAGYVSATARVRSA
jgi:hypothetical protein